MNLEQAKEKIRYYSQIIIGEWGDDGELAKELPEILEAIDNNTPWFPPAIAERPDGYECLVWHRGRWRHVKWVAQWQGWQFGYATAHIPGDLGRLFAPLPWNTPEADFWQGAKS